ncbi:protein amnionless-like [Mytilus edulis]|uniref:protein amnionless-like n=1 Tax=Mytilus edulis TaxID=6550 RepID=UPI0039F07E2C
MDVLSLLIFLVILIQADGSYKRWIPNTNFDYAYNWDSGKPPCGDTIAVFSDDSPSVYMQMNTTLKELRLPSTDITLILDNDFVLGFTDVPDNNPSCLSNGQEIHFNKTYPSDWFDPKNWCSSTTETGNCTDMVLESEMVPCSYDNVVFPKDSSFFVNVEAEMEIVVNTLKISGKALSTNTLSSFLKTDMGTQMFPKPHTGERSKIKLSRRPCNNPLGCICGNDLPEILQRICSIQKPYCAKQACKHPILLTGGCCEICGAKLTAEYGTGFNFDTLRNGLQRNQLDGKEDFKDVKFVVSRTSNDKIQISLTDKHGGLQSIHVATLMKADIDQDILSGGFKYSLGKIAMEQSGPAIHTPSAGARTGGSGGNGGETAGIVIGVLVVIGFVFAGLFFLYRRRSIPEISGFKVFDRISFRRPKVKRPHVEVPPFLRFSFRSEQAENVGPSHQGFENPIFGNSPIGVDKPMDLELMPPPLESEEQPTFDTSGFDNPLYDTYIQESPFSDAATVENEEPSKEKSGLPED